MTWTKLSDDFTDDTWTMTDAAFRLHVDGLVWSNRKLLDMHLPKADVRRFAKNPDSVGELVANGWWKDCGTYYEIVHHARYQRTRQAVQNQQKVNKENRSARGKATPPTRELPQFNESSHDSSNDSSHEMDRTGQANYESDDSVTQGSGEVVDSWAVRTPGAGDAEFCRHDVAIGFACSECKAEAARAAGRSAA